MAPGYHSFGVLRLSWNFHIFWDPKCYVVRQLVRHLLYEIHVVKNDVLFYLIQAKWWKLSKYYEWLPSISLYKIWEDRRFHWPLLSGIRIESTILFLYGRKRAIENQNYCIFYVVFLPFGRSMLFFHSSEFYIPLVVL